MTLVVDASVVVDVVADVGPVGRASRVALLAGQHLVAPDLLDVETASALRRRWLRGDLAPHRFDGALRDLEALPIERHSCLPLMRRALELRDNLTPYEAAYVALAEALGCPLLTADAHLAASPGPRCEIQLLRSRLCSPTV